MARITIKNRSSGLTLTELLVVMSIIIMLLLLAYMAYRTQIYKAWDARRKSDLYQLRVGLEEYEKDNDCYPTTLSCDPGDDLRPYMDKIPCDPELDTSYLYYPEGGACPGWFWIFTELDYSADPRLWDSGCYFGCGPTPGDLNYDYYESSTNAPAPYIGTPYVVVTIDGTKIKEWQLQAPDFDELLDIIFTSG